jgi:hypothetical protein
MPWTERKGDTLIYKRQPHIRTFHLPHFQIISMVEPKEGKWDPEVTNRIRGCNSCHLGFEHVNCWIIYHPTTIEIKGF